jgi:hypothetical protein
LIEAIETGERVLIPYRWEQIGSKRVTSSRMQLWSAHSAAKSARRTQLFKPSPEPHRRILRECLADPELGGVDERET